MLGRTKYQTKHYRKNIEPRSTYLTWRYHELSKSRLLSRLLSNFLLNWMTQSQRSLFRDRSSIWLNRRLGHERLRRHGSSVGLVFFDSRLKKRQGKDKRREVSWERSPFPDNALLINKLTANSTLSFLVRCPFFSILLGQHRLRALR